MRGALEFFWDLIAWSISEIIGVYLRVTFP